MRFQPLRTNLTAFGAGILDNLISTIREMSNVFKIIHGTNLSFYEEETYDEKISEKYEKFFFRMI